MLSIKSAKVLSRATIGRLPKVGHETCIIDDTIKCSKGFAHKRNVYLANDAGKLRIWEWISVEPHICTIGE